ncbi:MAG: FKBP12-associated protein [Pycnora praestabilis]|nr:MAG: FKBP12-associated protein [Pycnora praestabilis]
MATATPTPSQSNEAPTQKPRQRQRWQKLRRNGGQNGFPNDGDTLDTFGPRIGQGTGGRAQPARDALLAMRPASVAPTSQPPSAEPSSADVSAAENKNSRRQQNRGGRGGNRQVVSGPESGGEAVQSLEGHGRRQIHGAGTRLNAGRHFGGQLTVNDGAEESGTSSSLLQGDAPEFCPGRPHTQQRAAPGKPKAATQGKIREPPHGPRDRRGSKSSAPDIATRTQEDIARGLYECPICTSEAYHLIHVDRPVENPGYSPRNVPTLANFYVMLGLVHRVHTLGQLRAAFAASSPPQGGAWTRITIMAGVVDRYAEISCLVESTPASAGAMKGYAALVR